MLKKLNPGWTCVRKFEEINVYDLAAFSGFLMNVNHNQSTVIRHRKVPT